MTRMEDDDLIDLIENLMRFEPSERMSAEEALQRLWFCDHNV